MPLWDKMSIDIRRIQALCCQYWSRSILKGDFSEARRILASKR
jgi:hypothetical protein